MRGDWNKVTKREIGNFSVLVDFIGSYSSKLNACLTRNARYLSPKIQNEFIKIVERFQNKM